VTSTCRGHCARTTFMLTVNRSRGPGPEPQFPGRQPGSQLGWGRAMQTLRARDCVRWCTSSPPHQHHRRVPHLGGVFSNAVRLRPTTRCRPKTCGSTRAGATKEGTRLTVMRLSTFHEFRYRHPKEIHQLGGFSGSTGTSACTSGRIRDLVPHARGRHPELQVHRLVSLHAVANLKLLAWCGTTLTWARALSTGVFVGTGASQVGSWNKLQPRSPTLPICWKGDRALSGHGWLLWNASLALLEHGARHGARPWAAAATASRTEHQEHRPSATYVIKRALRRKSALHIGEITLPMASRWCR
jgi:hypothetical protein